MSATNRRHSPTDDDENLVVDVVDTNAYGPSQYTEADVIPLLEAGGPDEEDRVALREAVIR